MIPGHRTAVAYQACDAPGAARPAEEKARQKIMDILITRADPEGGPEGGRFAGGESSLVYDMSTGTACFFFLGPHHDRVVVALRVLNRSPLL